MSMLYFPMNKNKINPPPPHTHTQITGPINKIQSRYNDCNNDIQHNKQYTSSYEKGSNRC